MKLTNFVLFAGCVNLLILFANCQCHHLENGVKADYKLTGEIKGIDTGWIYIKHRQTRKIDSAVVKNGRFTVIGKTETPEYCNIGSGSSGRRIFYCNFFLAARKMTIKATKEGLFDCAIEIKGYPVQDEFRKLQKQIRTIDVISHEIWATTKTILNKDSLELKQKDLEQKRKDLIWNYAVRNPNSYVAALEASVYFAEIEDLQKLKIIFNKMNPALKKWYYAQKIERHLQDNNINLDHEN